MTLIIAAIGENCVVFGSDSRGTMSTLGEAEVGCDRIDKIQLITEHVVALICGDGMMGQHFIEEYKEKLDSKNDGVTSIARNFGREYCRETYDEGQMFLRSSDRPYLGFILAGLDISKGSYCMPKVYKICSRNNFEPGLATHGYATDGADGLAKYILNKLYDSNLSVSDLCYLVGYTIAETIRSNIYGVGGEINIGYMTPHGVVETAPEAEIKKWTHKFPISFEKKFFDDLEIISEDDD